VKTQSAHCSLCGQPIRFLSAGGVVRPVHKAPTACSGVPRRRRKVVTGETLPFPVVFPAAFEQPVQRYTCPCQGKDTLRVRHKDGCLAFDRLDWPWQRHICGRTSVANYGVDHLLRLCSTSEAQPPSLALVAGAQKTWGARSLHVVAVQELREGGGRFCLRFEGEDLPPAVKRLEVIEPGSFVALSRDGAAHRLVTTSGFEFRCADPRAWPEELGIPLGWIDPNAALI
jgi:hypothetical protein